MKINLPYGNSSIGLILPDDRVLGVLQNDEFERKNIRKLLIRSLRRSDLPFRKKRVLVVVPDATRSAHLKEMLPILMEKLSTPGRSIDIMIATGLHKRHTPEQLQRLLGAPIVKHHKILHHDPSENSVMDLGRNKYDVPITLDKAILNYDFIISIGVIEPHLYAGYSGGAKTIAIGLAGEATINATHSIKFLDDPATNIGSVKENKFQETLWDALKNIPPIFSINTVNNQDGKALKVFCGPVKDVFEKSIDFARRVFEVSVTKTCDIAICGVGYPKDINLYQASRALNYVLSVDSPVVRKGGVVIVAAQLRDGIGQSPSEKRFYDELKKITSPESFISHIRTEGCIAGEHRAYMVAKAMMNHKVMFVTTLGKDFMEGLPFKFYRSIEQAVKAAEDIIGKNSKIYVIPHALATIARAIFS
ncbi:MAG: nickel-dependent lactate racemase [Candidatus Omnitrophota bacterium]|nr:nickel-dependent lactate racemase [Candidatus Omnitrophota bacterium]